MFISNRVVRSLFALSMLGVTTSFTPVVNAQTLVGKEPVKQEDIIIHCNKCHITIIPPKKNS